MPLPRLATRPFRTELTIEQNSRSVGNNYSLKLLIPAGGDDRRGYAALACTPYPAKQRLRRAGDLSRGFLY
jgi:hypothetical protein